MKHHFIEVFKQTLRDCQIQKGERKKPCMEALERLELHLTMGNGMKTKEDMNEENMPACLNITQAL